MPSSSFRTAGPTPVDAIAIADSNPQAGMGMHATRDVTFPWLNNFAPCQDHRRRAPHDRAVDVDPRPARSSSDPAGGVKRRPKLTITHQHRTAISGARASASGGEERVKELGAVPGQ